jgi:uncharacterized protein
MKLVEAETFILKELRAKLSDTLYYHSLNHVLDVSEASLRIAEAEGITDPTSLKLLRTAAIFHDTGFTVTYTGHEDAGCSIARKVLPHFQYSPEEISAICGMIRATKIPQNPTNKLEEILCDADLDYLGRDDFKAIASCLYRELKARDMVESESAWNEIQIRFMETHQYWTPTARRTRQAHKLQHLKELRNTLHQANN